MNLSSFRTASTALLLLLALAPVVSAGAATVMQVPVDTLTQASGLIFEGRVIGEESRWVDGGQAIATFVTFEVSDVLKGTATGQLVTLRFYGGEIDGVRMEISGVQTPLLGERGIYFVESNAETDLHPLTGWAQGHFLVSEGVDADRVLTGHAEPVLRMHRQHKASGIGETAAGIVLGSPADLPQALTLDAFKRTIADLVAETT